MAKAKPTPLKQNCDIVRSNIMLLAAANGLRTDREIAARIGIAQSTYCDRRHEPKQWTLEQLTCVAIAFKTTVQWLVSPHNITEEVT